MDFEEVAIRQSILGTLARYCRALDRMDEKLFEGVWHPDATVDYEGLYEGPAVGLREYLWKTHASMAVHSHQIANVEIRSDDGLILSEAYVTVHLWTLPDRDGRQVEVLSRGRYLDRWDLGEGLCRIFRRVHLADMQSFRPLESGRTDPGATRDVSDRSYKFFSGEF
jgi:hypothetical protein